MSGQLVISARPGRALRIALLAVSAAFAPLTGVPQGAVAQDYGQALGTLVAPILLVDRERLFAESAYGMRITSLLEAERQRQEARTRAIEEELKAEELALTEERPKLSAEAFRARADAFDAKVEEVRRERDQAESALRGEIERAQAQFLQQVSPVLAGILQDYNALMMLDKRLALLAVREVDVTDEAIARIDAALAQSGGAEVPDGTLPLEIPVIEPESPPESPGEGDPGGVDGAPVTRDGAGDGG